MKFSSRFFSITSSMLLLIALHTTSMTTFALEYTTKDKSFEAQLKGHIQYDYNHYADIFNADDKGNNKSRWFTRRSRMAVQGTVLKDWEYKIQWNLGIDSNRNNAKGGTSDAVYLRYKGIDHLLITVGQHKEPFGFEQLTSSKAITAIERAAPIQVFSPGKSIGVTIKAKYGNITWATNYADEGKDGDDDLARAYSTRFTYSPKHTIGDVLHLGLAYTDRKETQNKINVRPELRDVDKKARIRSASFNANNFKAIGSEFVWIKSKFHLQAEYFFGKFEALNNTQDYKINGWYIQTGFFLTNDTHRYSFSKGAFSNTKPKSKQGGVEIFTRYSETDLDDHNKGNIGTITTLGLNWYINKHYRIGINVLSADYKKDINGEDNGNAIAARLQMAF